MDLRTLYDPALDEHVQETLDFNAKLPVSPDPTEWTPEAIAQMRDLSNVMDGVFATEPLSGFETRRIDGPGGPIPLRTYVPDEVRAVYLDIHGGGFFMGEASMGDASNRAIADHAKVATVSVDYRLAPEHPYPAGPDDCEAAALWLLENAGSEFGTDRLLIGGGSSGGNLSVVTLLRLRDHHQAAGRFAAANLLCGVYDNSGTPSHHRGGTRSFVDLYLPEHDALARRAPDLSPLYADLAGLPPTLLTVGTADFLYDDSLFMAMRWRAAGNECELAVYPECVHGFTMFPTALGRIATARVHAFLATHAAG